MTDRPGWLGPAPETTPLFTLVVTLDPPLVIGSGPLGKRVLFGAAGGTFHGPELRGVVVPGGGDWAQFRPDGTMALDVRLTLRTDDGALISMTYGGRWTMAADVRQRIDDPSTRAGVTPDEYSFRTTPLFETGAARYAWLNDIVGVGVGYLVDDGVAYDVYRL